MAVRLASDLRDKVHRIVIVSAIINGAIVKNRTTALVKIAYRLRLYSRVAKVIKNRFETITKVLVADTSFQSVLSLYSDMLIHLDAKVITKSIYQLFSGDWTKYLMDIKVRTSWWSILKTRIACFEARPHILGDVCREKSLYTYMALTTTLCCTLVKKL